MPKKLLVAIVKVHKKHALQDKNKYAPLVHGNRRCRDFIIALGITAQLWLIPAAIKKGITSEINKSWHGRVYIEPVRRLAFWGIGCCGATI